MNKRQKGSVRQTTEEGEGRGRDEPGRKMQSGQMLCRTIKAKRINEAKKEEMSGRPIPAPTRIRGAQLGSHQQGGLGFREARSSGVKRMVEDGDARWRDDGLGRKG